MLCLGIINMTVFFFGSIKMQNGKKMNRKKIYINRITNIKFIEIKKTFNWGKKIVSLSRVMYVYLTLFTIYAKRQ